MTNLQKRRIAMLTSGGDAPGLNAVIRAVTKAAIGAYGCTVLGIEDGYEGCITRGYRELTFDDVRGILPRGGTILGASNRCNPFWFANRAGGEAEPRDHSMDVLKWLHALDIDALIVIGGDGSMAVARELHQLGVPIVGVPKTIDNDVKGTQVTFGFDTAVTTVVDALDKLHTTAESHHRVMIVEVMGRTAGWIALYAGLAGGADVILLPEILFDLDEVQRKIERRAAEGRSFTIVVVAEGASPLGGTEIYETIGTLSYERRYGGMGQWVLEQLGSRMEQEVRLVVLGHLQRGGSPSSRDRLLGTMFGAAAVRMVANGQTGQMVAMESEAGGPDRPSFVAVPLAVAGAGARLVPLNHPAIAAAQDLHICLGEPGRLKTEPATA
ncbi:MAG TPA: ATP-dependent 6-phosphofructokinase [Nitrolancea sp.]|nr:ATP-dependent 6-phosphofructokinase [Nitrolancea sp.]